MKENQKFRVAGIGELLWDLLPEGKKLGGAPANFAFHAGCMNAESTIISAVGNDDQGKEILIRLRELKLDERYIQCNQQRKTGVVNVSVNGGNPEYEIRNNVAWDFIHWSPQLAKLAGITDAVCFGSLAQRSEVSRHTILKFLKATRPECLRVFDINLRQDFFNREIIESSMDLSSVLKLNDEELSIVAQMFSLKGSEGGILEKLSRRFRLEMIVLTKGSRGSLLKTGNEESFLEAPAVDVKDTVGAGDAFTAAIVIARLHGKSMGEMHKVASDIAAYVCSSNGATPVLPHALAKRVN